MFPSKLFTVPRIETTRLTHRFIDEARAHQARGDSAAAARAMTFAYAWIAAHRRVVKAEDARWGVET